MDDDVTAIVIDIGSSITKAGFAGDDIPRSVFQTVTGKPKVPGIMVGLDQKDLYIGDDAIRRRGVLKLDYPVRDGVVENWDGFEKLMHHIFYRELQVSPEEHPILLTEPPLNPQANSDKIKQIMFETFNVNALYMC